MNSAAIENKPVIGFTIGDINGVAISLWNIGDNFIKKNQIKEAVIPIYQAYQIFQKIGSPDAKNTEGYLNAIKQRIGETEFERILSQMG